MIKEILSALYQLYTCLLNIALNAYHALKDLINMREAMIACFLGVPVIVLTIFSIAKKVVKFIKSRYL